MVCCHIDIQYRAKKEEAGRAKPFFWLVEVAEVSEDGILSALMTFLYSLYSFLIHVLKKKELNM